jgi:anti-sigma factor RsiW
MECRQVQKRLSAFQDGELKPQERGKVSEHLESCSACCERYEEMERVWQALGDFQEIPPEPGFYGQLLKKINEPKETRFPTRRQRFQGLFQFFSPSWATVALLIVGTLMGTFLGNTLVKNELLHFQQNRTYSQAAAEVFSLRAFDPVPPGTIGERYLRMANFGEDGHR